MHHTKKARPTSFPRHANVIRLQLYIHASQWVDKIVYQTSETKKNAQKIHANFASTAKSCWTKAKRNCLHSFRIFKCYCKMPDTKLKTKQAKYFLGFVFVFVESVSTHFFFVSSLNQNIISSISCSVNECDDWISKHLVGEKQYWNFYAKMETINWDAHSCICQYQWMAIDNNAWTDLEYLHCRAFCGHKNMFANAVYFCRVISPWNPYRQNKRRSLVSNRQFHDIMTKNFDR